MKMLLVILLMITASSHASDKGNGGGLHFCSDGRTEMYDIYEGYTRYDLSPTRNRSTTEEYVKKAVEKMKKYYPGFGREVEFVVDYLLTRRNLILRSNLQMELIKDANLLVIGIGCEYRQLANWDNKSNKVIVKKEYFDQLDPVNQAALYLHEAVYYVLRLKARETNSDNARRTVAEAFDDAAEFTYVSGWEISFYESPKIIRKPKPMELDHFYSWGNTLHLNLHLGDEDFYDEKNDIRVLVSLDLTKPKNIIAVNENGIMTRKTEIESLNAQVSQTRSREKKERLMAKIKVLANEVFYLEHESKNIKRLIEAFEDNDNTVMKKIGCVYTKSYDNFFGEIPEEARELEFTFTAMINNLVVGKLVKAYKAPVEWQTELFCLRMSQNVQD